MARRRPAKRDALLVEVIAALGAGGVDPETWLEDVDGRLLDGAAEPDGRVRINEASCIVRPLVRELLHRVRPHWTEHGVASWGGRFFHQLTHAEIERIYDVYVAVKKRR